MNDLAVATASPLPTMVAGRQVEVRPRTLAELGALQSWFRREIPSPLARAIASVDQCKRQGVGSAWAYDLAIETAQRAELAWPPRIGSWHWLDAVDQAGKQAHVVAWCLGLPEEEAATLVAGALPGELGTVVCLAFEGRYPDPKELPPATSRATPSPTTGEASSTTSA